MPVGRIWSLASKVKGKKGKGRERGGRKSDRRLFFTRRSFAGASSGGKKEREMKTKTERRRSENFPSPSIPPLSFWCVLKYTLAHELPDDAVPDLVDVGDAELGGRGLQGKVGGQQRVLQLGEHAAQRRGQQREAVEQEGHKEPETTGCQAHYLLRIYLYVISGYDHKLQIIYQYIYRISTRCLASSDFPRKPFTKKIKEI